MNQEFTAAGARISGGRRERDRGESNLPLETPMMVTRREPGCASSASDRRFLPGRFAVVVLQPRSRSRPSVLKLRTRGQVLKARCRLIGGPLSRRSAGAKRH